MFEHKRVAHGDLASDLVIHGIDVGLVHTHTLFGQLGSIVDRYIMKFWMIAPIFILEKSTPKHFKLTLKN